MFKKKFGIPPGTCSDISGNSYWDIVGDSSNPAAYTYYLPGDAENPAPTPTRRKLGKSTLE